MDKRSPIGVFDSGVGGLTVVRELQRLLPGEDIVYFGDSFNCPYGYRQEDEIVGLASNIIGFLCEKGVKTIAIACNTISVTAPRLRRRFATPIVDIVSPAAEAVAAGDCRDVGLIATDFTVSSRAYDRLIATINPKIKVTGKGSARLAALVDAGCVDQVAIDADITANMSDILSRAPVGRVILGCTHYPIVEENFRRLYPNMDFVNPALTQAKAVKKLLEQQGLTNPQEYGKYEIYTSGDPEVYLSLSRRMSIAPPKSMHVVKCQEAVRLA